MKSVTLNLRLPSDICHFQLPVGVKARLTALLDKQDMGHALTAAERKEADGLVELAESLSLLKLRASRVSSPATA